MFSEGLTGRCPVPPSQPLLSALCSHSRSEFLLPGSVPARSCFSLPMSATYQCPQTKSHPLCAQVCPAEPSWQQDTAQEHLREGAGQMNHEDSTQVMGLSLGKGTGEGTESASSQTY